jgi:hypothetical protein
MLADQTWSSYSKLDVTTRPGGLQRDVGCGKRGSRVAYLDFGFAIDREGRL